jgi:hypothetical protein
VPSVDCSWGQPFSFSRRAALEVFDNALPKETGEGGRRANRRDSPFCVHVSLALLACASAASNTWRLSARRPAFLSRRRAALSPGYSRSSASSWQAARSGQPGGAPTPPECVLCEGTPAGAGLTHTNGATGSRPLMGPGGTEFNHRLCGILSYNPLDETTRPSLVTIFSHIGAPNLGAIGRSA